MKPFRFVAAALLLLAACGDRSAEYVAGPPVVAAAPPSEAPTAVPLFCFPHADMRARIAHAKAVPLWRGLIGNGIYQELYVVADGTGWASVIWHPSGFSCLGNDGDEWRFAAPGEDE